MMNPIKWKFRNIIILFGSIFALSLFFFAVQKVTYENYSSVIIPKAKPHEVWEYMADFNNMKLLNPTIHGFTIINETGFYDDWKYTVSYDEHLSHWPYLANHILAHFQITREDKYNLYSILSRHNTCLFEGLYCLQAKSIFWFMASPAPIGTQGRESISYQCPRIMRYFCQREVSYQRKAIMDNLLNIFSAKYN